MMIKSIAPCDGWFYTARGSLGEDIVFKVAAWAVLESGDVVGMIPVSDGVTGDNIARLVPPLRSRAPMRLRKS